MSDNRSCSSPRLGPTPRPNPAWLALPTATLEYSFAALLEAVAAAFSYHLAQSMLHTPDLMNLGIEFGELFQRQFLPACEGRRLRVKAAEKLSHFRQREPKPLCVLNHRQPMKYGCIIAPLSADSLRIW